LQNALSIHIFGASVTQTKQGKALKKKGIFYRYSTQNQLLIHNPVSVRALRKFVFSKVLFRTACGKRSVPE